MANKRRPKSSRNQESDVESGTKKNLATAIMNLVSMIAHIAKRQDEAEATMIEEFKKAREESQRRKPGEPGSTNPHSIHAREVY